MVANGSFPPLRVLLPLLGSAAADVVDTVDAVDIAALVPLAAQLAGSGGHLVLLAVVPVLHGQDLPIATARARAARRQLRALARLVPAGVTHEEIVRASESLATGLRQVAGEASGMLLVPLPSESPVAALGREPYAQLVASPVCDTIFIRPGRRSSALRSVLVSARGGPHAELALEVAQRLARAEGASVTVMHVDVPRSSPGERQQEQRLFQSLVARSADAPRLRTSSVPAESAEEAIVAESPRHDLIVLGARVDSGLSVDRAADRTPGLGLVPLAAIDRADAAVLVVKSRQPVNPAIFKPRPPPVDELVNSWFVENTTHCRDYSNLDELIAEKQRRGLTIAVALLAGVGSDTLAAHARVLIDELGVNASLVDETILFSRPDEQILEAARTAGLRVCVVPEAGSDDRGRLIFASLRRLTSDIVLWIDADIRNPHAKLVYGLAGPLIVNEAVEYVKGFYGLPPQAADSDLQNVVGEFTARPLLNLFFAELSGLIDPLGAEHAIRRATGLRLPIFSGSAAPVGLLIDVFERFGLPAISQVALEERIARPVEMIEASRRAFSVTQIISNRLGLTAQEPLRNRTSPTIKLIHQTEGHFEIDLIDAHETELRP